MTDSRIPPGYTYVGQLGKGGTAEVIQARTERTGREVALKLPLTSAVDSDVPFNELVKREQQLIAGLQFPGLVRILDASYNDPAYLALEICSGAALDEVGRIDDISLTLNILSAIAVDLEYLNLMGICHGDLKPQNIFLPPDWQQSFQTGITFAKISDFSLGKKVGESDSERVGLGTVGFMAPETIAEGQLTHQSDLFALGVIAYQLLTGEHPFMEGETDPVRINARCTEEEPKPLQELRPDSNDGIIDLVMLLLSKQVSARPSSAWKVCQQLRTAGATYPFDKILSPVYGIRENENYEKNVELLLSLDEHEKARLNILSNRSNTKLRLILSANHRRNNLIYNDHRFSFKTTIYWPNCLRRKALSVFCSGSYTVKKELIKNAIVGYETLSLESDNIQTNGYDPALIPTTLLLRHLLSNVTIKRLSSALANEAEHSNNYESAAKLYVQAGDLPQAERCAYEAAVALHKEHYSIRALRLLKHVIEYGNLAHKQFDTRHLLMLKGDILKDLGEADQALTVYNEIITLYKNRKSDKLLAETYKDIGDLQRIRQKFKEGLSALNQALAIYQEHDDQLEISHTLNNIGNIYWIISDLKSAITYYRPALHIQRQLDAKAEIASTLGNIGSVYVLRGKFKRSIQIMKLSLNLKKELGNAGEIARTLNNLGYVYYLSGKPNKAVACLQESLEINRRIGSKKEILYNLENLTVLMISAGQLKESIQTLKEGMKLAESVGDKPHFGIFHSFMSTVLRRMGRYSEAEKSLVVVDKVVSEIDDKLLQIQAKTNRASIRLALGDRKQAFAIAVQAEKEAAELNAKPEQLNALLVLTRINDSPQYEQTALTLTDELKLTREKLLVKCNRLELLLHAEKYQEANQLVENIISKTDTISEDIELAWIRNLLAEYLLAIGSDEQAKTYLTRSLQLAESSNLIPEKINSLIMMGKLQTKLGNYEQSFTHYKEALKLAKQVAGNLSDDEDRKFYQSQRFVGFLVSEIKSLQSKIGHKRPAVASA